MARNYGVFGLGILPFDRGADRAILFCRKGILDGATCAGRAVVHLHRQK